MSGRFRYIASVLLIIGGIIMTGSSNWYIGIGAVTLGVALLSKKKHKVVQKPKTKEGFVFTDEMIMRLAKREGGLLSPVDLSSQSSISLEEAKKRLDDLHMKNIAEIKITEQGNIVYDFKMNFLSDSDKDNAKDIFE